METNKIINKILKSRELPIFGKTFSKRLDNYVKKHVENADYTSARLGIGNAPTEVIELLKKTCIDHLYPSEVELKKIQWYISGTGSTVAFCAYTDYFVISPFCAIQQDTADHDWTDSSAKMCSRLWYGY